MICEIMPIISIFFGIVIRINFGDHNPPHLHAEYQDHEGLFDIRTGALMEGGLPRKQTAMVTRWIEQNREALAENWHRAYNRRPTFKIPGPDPR